MSEREYLKIQGALQAADSATIHTDKGADIHIDLKHLRHHASYADFDVWGYHDSDSERRNRLRLFCDAEYLGESDDSGSFDVTARMDIDAEAVHEEIDAIEDRLDILANRLGATQVTGQ